MKSIIPILCVCILLAAPGAATPPLPCEFYGSVMIDNAPAPAGSTIIGFINGNERGKIVTDTAGYYGGPGIFDSRLKVDAIESELNGTNLEISFTINGKKADQVAPFNQGDSKQLDLSIGSTIMSTKQNQTPSPVVTNSVPAHSDQSAFSSNSTLTQQVLPVYSSNNSYPPERAPVYSANTTITPASYSIDRQTSDRSPDGSASMIFTAGSQIRDPTGQFLQGVTITRKDTMSLPPVPDTGFRYSGYSYEITPADCLFIPQSTLQINISPADIGGISSRSPVIRHYNPATAVWENMSTTVNRADGEVHAVLTRSGLYALFEKNTVQPDSYSSSPSSSSSGPVTPYSATGIPSPTQTPVQQAVSPVSPLVTAPSVSPVATTPVYTPNTPGPTVNPGINKTEQAVRADNPAVTKISSVFSGIKNKMKGPVLFGIGVISLIIIGNLLCYLVYRNWWMKR